MITLRALVSLALVATATRSSALSDAQRQRYASLVTATANDNVKVVRAAIAAFNAGKDDDFIAAFSPSHRLRELGDEDAVAGREKLSEKLAALRQPFPNLRIVPSRFIAGKSFVAVQAVLAGRHDGRFRGQAATKRRVAGDLLLVAYVGAGEIAQSIVAVPTRHLDLQVRGVVNAPNPPANAAQIVASRAALPKGIYGELGKAARAGVGLHVAASRGKAAARKAAFRPVAFPMSNEVTSIAAEAFEAAGDPSIAIEEALVADDHVVALFSVSGVDPALKDGALVAKIANGKIEWAQTYVTERL